MTNLETLIGSVGFPIVAFLMMYKLNRDVISKNTEAINNLRATIIELVKNGRDRNQ